MMESIEKLRELLKGCGCSDQCYSCGINFHGNIADEIEAEIAEKYMLIPRDADDRCIEVGDHMEHDGRRFVVNGITLWHNTWRVITDSERFDGSFDMRVARECRHVKPRTIEDVLADFASKQHGITTEENDALIAECAEEIRELMEVD